MLHIGGIGLARGYWRDEERTRASFILHPDTGERLYRTGDLGRYRPDGTVELLGREDTQVKIQGHRIELGEIEAAFLLHPGVRAAVVSAAGDPRGVRRLVAHVVPTDGGATESELRRFLGEKLPASLQPSSITLVPHLPLSRNGKVDRSALTDARVNGKEPAAASDAFAPTDRATKSLIAI